MSASLRKAVVRLLTGEVHFGYVPASNLAVTGGAELLLPDGRALSVSLSAVKHIAFVKDFNASDTVDPEQMGLRSFPARPRGDGLWVRVEFVDNDRLEGLMPGGLPLLDALLLDQGIFLEPPDRRSNTQRLFIPRSALAGFEILGMASGSTAARRRTAPQPSSQGDLFDTTE